MSDRMSIVVISCDAFEDIVSGYLRFLRENWADCPYPIFVSMEDKTFVDDTVKVLPCGMGNSWTKRAIIALESAKTEYILLTVDDLYMSERVDTNDFEAALDFMDREKVDYYRIPTFKVPGQKSIDHPRNSNVELIPKNRTYGITFGSSIWRKGELLRVLGDGTKTAWDLENDFSKSAAEAELGYYDSYVADKRHLLHSVHMAKGGKWLPDAVREIREKGYELDLGNRELVSRSTDLKYKIYARGSQVCPRFMRRGVKKILTAMGFKFATEY